MDDYLIKGEDIIKWLLTMTKCLHCDREYRRSLYKLDGKHIVINNKAWERHVLLKHNKPVNKFEVGGQ